MAFAIPPPPAATLSSITVDKTAPQSPGTTMTFTATASGGISPYSYKWWVVDGATWTVVQEWTASNAYAWTPATANASYRGGVWVRSGGQTPDSGGEGECTGR